MKDPLANLDVRRAARRSTAPPRSATPGPGTPTANSATSAARKHQREVVCPVGNEAISPWTVINPVRYFRVNTAGAGVVRVSEGTCAVRAGAVGAGDDPGRRQNGLTCVVPVADFAVNWDPSAPSRCSSSSTRTTPRHPARTSARRPASRTVTPARPCRRTQADPALPRCDRRTSATSRGVTAHRPGVRIHSGAPPARSRPVVRALGDDASPSGRTGRSGCSLRRTQRRTRGGQCPPDLTLSVAGR